MASNIAAIDPSIAASSTPRSKAGQHPSISPAVSQRPRIEQTAARSGRPTAPTSLGVYDVNRDDADSTNHHELRLPSQLSQNVRGGKTINAAKWKLIDAAKAIKHQMREYLEPTVVRWVSGRVYSHDGARRFAAIAEGIEYAETHMQGAERLSDSIDVLKAGLKVAPKTGLFAEFGVWRGNTINVIAAQVEKQTTVHGFDSFEGLPEDWMGEYRRGTFHMKGALPKVRPNVVLHQGWFDDTVPKFAAEHPDTPVAFLHIDCDLYSSTKVIFDGLGDRLRPGSVIVFDEYFNYPGWREHEYKAFRELLQARSLRYRYVAYNDSEFNVTVQITE